MFTMLLLLLLLLLLNKKNSQSPVPVSLCLWHHPDAQAFPPCCGPRSNRQWICSVKGGMSPVAK